jgi:hypothetical protein
MNSRAMVIPAGNPSKSALHWPASGRALIPALALIMLLAGATGTVTALGDTLFPAASLGSAFAQDFSSNSHYLLRLRALHPATAVIATVLVAWLLARIWRSANRSLQNLALVVRLIFLFQLALGALNVVLLAPMWLQIYICSQQTFYGLPLCYWRQNGFPLKVLIKAASGLAVAPPVGAHRSTLPFRISSANQFRNPS